MSYDTVKDYVVSLANQKMAMLKPKVTDLSNVNAGGNEDWMCGNCGFDDCDCEAHLAAVQVPLGLLQLRLCMSFLPGMPCSAAEWS